MSHYGHHGWGYGQRPGQHTPYPPPHTPFVPPPPPPQYGHYPYAQSPHPGYGRDSRDPYREPYVPPNKRYKFNTGYHHPPSAHPPAPSPAPFAQYPYPVYSPAPPPPPPGYGTPAPPPPPPAVWSASPPPASVTPTNYNVVLQPHGDESLSPPTEFGQEEDHHKKFSKNQHNQASHWHSTHGIVNQPGRRFTSLQWVAKKDGDPSMSKSPTVGTPTPAKAGPSIPAVAQEVQSSLTPATTIEHTEPKAVVIKTEEGVVPTTEKSCDEVDDWDFDNYWPEEGEHVDEQLSLGCITWRPPEGVKHALSAIWAEAEEQELGNVPWSDTEYTASVSFYTTEANLNDACRPVNRWKEWHSIRGDPAFADLSKEARFISVDQLKKRREVRADTPESMDIDEDEEEGELSKEYTVLDKPRTSLYARREVKKARTPHRQMSEDDGPYSPPDDDGYSPPPVASQEDEYVPDAVVSRSQAASSKPTPDDLQVPRNHDKSHVAANAISTGPSHAAIPASMDNISVRQPQAHTRPLISDATQDPMHGSNKRSPGNVASAAKKQIPASTRSPVQLDQQQEDILARLGVAPVKAQLDQHQEDILAELGVEPVKTQLDQQQEDILAKLGVTGAPKPVGSKPDAPMRGTPIPLPAKATQEEVLAMLGVTGAPKPVGSIPGPSYKALKSQDLVNVIDVQAPQSGNVGDTASVTPPKLTAISATRPTAVNTPQPRASSTQAPPAVPEPPPFAALLHQVAPRPPPPPPPPPPPEEPSVDTTMIDAPPFQTAFDAFNSATDRPSSSHSQHTQAGSDFHEEEAEPDPQLVDVDAKPMILDESEGEDKTPGADINIGKGSLRARLGRAPASAAESVATASVAESDGEQKTPEPDINIGKASLRTRKRSRKQIEADEDADVVDVETADVPSRKRQKKQIIVSLASSRKRKTATS